MTQFEYVVPFVAIILGLALADLLTSLHRYVQGRQHVKWHPLPIMLVALSFLLVLQAWRAFYFTRDAFIVSNFFGFAFYLIGPVLVFLICAASLPEDKPTAEQAVDLLESYFERRYYLISLIVLYLIHGAIRVGILHNAWGELIQWSILAFIVPFPFYSSPVGSGYTSR